MVIIFLFLFLGADLLAANSIFFVDDILPDKFSKGEIAS